MIKFIITGQQLSIVTAKVVSGTHNYLEVEASFRTSDWTGLRKWAHFKMGDYNYILPFTDDKIASSQHLDLTEGTWEVYVHGNQLSDDEVTERITTDIKYLYVDAPHDGHPFPPLTPDVEEMLANEIEEAIDIAQSVRDDADDGEFDGATFTPSVNSSTGVISWTNDKGKTNPDPANIKGPKGDVGDTTVQVSTTEPTDPRINVWINPNGQAAKLITSAALISGTHQPGTYDTYKFTFTEGADLTFSIYNGADGEGSGDMLKSVYDSTNKAQDMFTYADTKAASEAAAVKDTTAVTGLLKGNGTTITAAVAGTDYQAPLTIDSAMSDSSTNTVQNKIIKAYVDSNAGGLFKCTTSGTNKTTYAEVAAAVAAGKIPVILGSGGDFWGFGYPVTVSNTTIYVFPQFYMTCSASGSISVSSLHAFGRVYRLTSDDTWTSSTLGTIITENDVSGTVTSGDSNPVSGNAVYNYVQQNKTTVDSALSSTSTNPVQNKVVYNAIQNVAGEIFIKEVQFPATFSNKTVGTVYIGSVSQDVELSGYECLGIAYTGYIIGSIDFPGTRVVETAPTSFAQSDEGFIQNVHRMTIIYEAKPTYASGNFTIYAYLMYKKA